MDDLTGTEEVEIPQASSVVVSSMPTLSTQVELEIGWLLSMARVAP